MFETKTNIKLHDTDAAGITFFVNHFRIAHTAYEAFMKSIGVGLDFIIRDADYYVLIAHAEADYKRPLFHGDSLTITLKAESIGNSSFVLGYEFNDGRERLAATLRTVHVAIDKKSGEKMPLPEKLRLGLDSIK
ncbi:MAG: thioesterase family protein [bacterium]